MNNIFQSFAASMDPVVISGMNDAITSGLAWAEPQLRVGLSLYVIGNALMMMYGKMDSGGFLSTVVRAMAVAAILEAPMYNYYVRDLFFTDLPNGFAAAINGPRAAVDSSKQFDALWEAVSHAHAFISGQSMGLAGPMNRLILWGLVGLDLAAIGVCFGIWYFTKILMAILIAIGPFLIILYLFRGTREYVNQWIGKLVGLIILQLGTSIVVRFVFLVLSDTMKGLNESQLAGNQSVDMMMMQMTGVTGIFFLGAGMMLVLPLYLTFGSGASAAVSAMTGMSAAVAKGVSVGTIRASAAVGKHLGKYTGGAWR